jgi:sugar-specific transcriptional regulator TrmB
MDISLQEFGFTKGEEKVYLALLRLGPSTTGPIAHEARVSRSKLYDILLRLGNKGLVSSVRRNRMLRFAAAPPSRISAYLDRKERKLKKRREELERSLPQLESYLKVPHFHDVEVFDGVAGLRNMRETLLEQAKTGDNWYFFGSTAAVQKSMRGYWDEYHRQRIRKKIHSWTIFNQDAREFGEQRKKLEYTDVKYLPVKAATPAWVGIYHDKILITIREPAHRTIVINDASVAKSFKVYFDVLWNAAVEKLP